MSLDSLNSHRKFIEKHRLPFPLLSDEQAAAAKAYGVYQKKTLYGKTFWGVVRTTFIIGPDGRIEQVFPKVKPAVHADEVLRFLRSGR